MSRQALADALLGLFCVAAVTLAILLGGCSLRPVVRLPARVEVAVTLDPALAASCAKLDRAVVGLTAGAVASGALGGSTGLASLWTSDTSRWVTGGVAAGTAVAGAVLGYLSNAYSARYTKQCTALSTGEP